MANTAWNLPPTLPEESKRLCIVEVYHTRINRRCYELLHWVGTGWKFQDNIALSNQVQVLRWAYVQV